MYSLLLFTKQFLRLNLRNNVKLNKTLINNNNGIGIRYLFTNEVLGVDGYLQTRDRINAQFGQMRDKFFVRMEEYVYSESKMLFTEDLKNIIFLVQNNEQELKLLSEAINKFHSQNQSLQFGTFVFGPIVMRLLHHLSECDLAVKLYKDPQLKGFFGQIKSLVTLMNLLYINGKYDQCLHIFEFTQNENYLESKYPRDCVLLCLASCYKLNTPEAFDKGLELLQKAKESGALISRKTVTLFAALALNQNKPNTALEILSLATQTNYISVRNLRLIALSELERFDDLFITLKVMINRDVPPETRGQEILEDTLTKIKAKIESKDDKQLITEFSQIERGLIEGNHVSPQTLDEVLTIPVVMRSTANPFSRDQGFRDQRGYRNQAIQQNYRRYPTKASNEEF